MSSTRYRNLGLFVLLGVLFGSSFVAIKAGLDALPPVFFAALRFDIAAPILLAYAAWRYDSWLPRTRADVVALLVGAVTIIAANNGLLFLGQQQITPAAASVMYGLNPILSPVFALFVLDSRLDFRGAVGILLGLLGVVIIVQPTPETLTSSSTIGQLYVLAAAAGIALGSVLTRRIESTIPSISLTAWAMAVGAVLLHVWSVGMGEHATTAALTPTVLLAILAVAIPSTAAAYPIYFTLIRRIGPVRTNLVAYVVPIVAALTGWLLLGESVTLATAVGFCVVVAGVALLERHVVAEEFARLTG
ncbi:Threonine/homoserine efflux transporter RhtA [Haloplanus vescus]|uniref:Threonine/homoserine efflux transporter RhtA n=1 Tax=Haloplanus vescus TaxID=555874 RepID=A0A1H3WDI7_9EURY|nr:EamA family transporter [Haloplanus vescus]SDZ84402.1 Threonine/homoserine efflux transporter RhtA [Haloplanus vescus]